MMHVMGMRFTRRLAAEGGCHRVHSVFECLYRLESVPKNPTDFVNLSVTYNEDPLFKYPTSCHKSNGRGLSESHLVVQASWQSTLQPSSPLTPAIVLVCLHDGVVGQGQVSHTHYLLLLLRSRVRFPAAVNLINSVQLDHPRQ